MFLRILIGAASVAVLTGGVWAQSVSTITQDATTTGAGAAVEQSGPLGSESTIEQLQYTAYSGVGVYQIDDGTTGASPANVSYVLQYGQYASGAGVSQSATGGETEGGPNNAWIRQYSSDPWPRAFNAASIDQAGNSNYASIAQDYVGGSEASISQDGTYNVGYIQQWYADGDDAGISQTGSSNYANTWQVGDGYSSDLFARTTQYGHANAANIYQGGTGNGAEVYQSGELNGSTITQSGANNYAFNDQWGSGNTSTIVQSNFGNQAYVYQWGNGHESTVTQNGVGGYVFVWQH